MQQAAACLHLIPLVFLFYIQLDILNTIPYDQIMLFHLRIYEIQRYRILRLLPYFLKIPEVPEQ